MDKLASPREYFKLLDDSVSQMEGDGLDARQMYHKLIQMGFREKDVRKKLKIGKFTLLSEQLVTAQAELDSWVKAKKWDSYVFSNQPLDFDTLKKCQEFSRLLVRDLYESNHLRSQILLDIFSLVVIIPQ